MTEVKNNLAAGSIQLDSVMLTSDITGDGIELKTVVYEFNVYEALNKPFVTADVFIADALALTTRIPIVGQEHMTISFKTPHPSIKDAVSMSFRVIRIEEFAGVNTRTAQYIIKLASEEYIADLRTKIMKAYREQPISKMVEAIIKDFLGSGKETDISETIGNRTLVIPNMKPSRALKFLAKESKHSRYEPSNFMFYENCSGFHFTTIEELIGKPYPLEGNTSPLPNLDDVDNPTLGRMVDTYYSTHKDFDGRNSDTGPIRGGTSSLKPFEFMKMNKFNFLSLFNNDLTMVKGGFENKLWTIDPAFSLFQEVTYNYMEDSDKLQHISSTGKDKLITENSGLIGTGDSLQSYFMTNQGHEASPFQDQKNEFFHLRLASLGLLQDIVVNVDIPGDSSRRAGDIVRLQFPEYGATDDVKGKLNKFVSGDYLVVAVRHLYNSEAGYKCVLQCVKNCYEQDIMANLEDRRLLQRNLQLPEIVVPGGIPS